MTRITKLTMESTVLDVANDWSMTTRATQPGPPVRIEWLTIGFVDLAGDPPHNGELHPDGDEFLYVVSGRLQVLCDSDPDPLELGPGDACIVPKGEWHRVHVLEPGRLIHMTPGPNGDHRPLAQKG